MNYEHIKKIIDGQFSDWMAVKPRKMTDGSELCQVTMPLLEPNGDVIDVYLMEKDGRILVNDGGHISGLLLESGCGRENQENLSIVERQLYYAGMKRDQTTGLVYVEADESGLRYWMTELAQLIAVLPHLLPKPSRNFQYLDFEKNTPFSAESPRIVWEVSKKLSEAGFDGAIQLNRTVPGHTGIRRRVEFAYTAQQSGFVMEKAVYVLAFDLNVRNPLEKASRKLGVANDLAWSAAGYTDRKVDVRLVYSLRTGVWDDAPEARLLTAAGEMSELGSYWWDDPEQQDRFMADVSKDLSPSIS